VDSRRVSGVLLPLTSLPSAYGIGDLGAAAFRFADLLTRTNQRLWQMLPVGPVGPGASPYSSPSTFAGNPLLIAPEPLVESGLLEADELEPLAALPNDRVDYERLVPRKRAVLRTAFRRFQSKTATVDATRFKRFRDTQSVWLNEYALYAALKEAHDGAPWTEWAPPLARCEPMALQEAREQHAEAIKKHIFWQYLFHRQWTALQAYCHARNIRLFGDLPIYVAHDSADVWAHQDLFHLDEAGEPTVVAGVPPDYFSPEGQRWGNPLYRWDRMKDHGYPWWTERLRRAFTQFDLVRLDHFRGFDEYWEIPAEYDTAIKGKWKSAPGVHFLDAMEEEFGALWWRRTSALLRTRSRRCGTGLPCRAWRCCSLPSGAPRKTTFCLTTTAATWSPTRARTTMTRSLAGGDTASRTRGRRLRRRTSTSRPLRPTRRCPSMRCGRSWHRSHAASWSRSRTCWAWLGTEARMNTPGTTDDNWTWRFTPDQLSEENEEMLKELTYVYGRASSYD